MLRRIALWRMGKISQGDPPQAEGMLQNTAGGTLSGDFSLKNNILSEKNIPKIHRNSYFTTSSF